MNCGWDFAVASMGNHASNGMTAQRDCEEEAWRRRQIVSSSLRERARDFSMLMYEDRVLIPGVFEGILLVGGVWGEGAGGGGGKGEEVSRGGGGGASVGRGIEAFFFRSRILSLYRSWSSLMSWSPSLFGKFN